MREDTPLRRGLPSNSHLPEPERWGVSLVATSDKGSALLSNSKPIVNTHFSGFLIQKWELTGNFAAWRRVLNPQ